MLRQGAAASLAVLQRSKTRTPSGLFFGPQRNSIPPQSLSSLSLDHSDEKIPADTATVLSGKCKPNFDAKVSRPLQHKSTFELLQSLLVFEACQFKSLVTRGDLILSAIRKVFGNWTTDTIVRYSFFQQFCGGENHDQVVKKMKELKKYGLNSILDYAAEDEGTSPRTEKAKAEEIIPLNQPAREYDYENEHQCNAHLETFLKCIRTVHDGINESKQFAAMKVTGLGSPQLLRRVSTVITQIHATVYASDETKKGYLTRDEFSKVMRIFSNDNDLIEEFLDHLDPNKKNAIDYLDLTSAAFALNFDSETSIKFMDIVPNNVKFSTEERDLIHALLARTNKIAKEASHLGVGLLVDAEQSWFQPAIDGLTVGLQQKYNHVDVCDRPVIFTTYQCYRKDALDHIKEDVERSKRLKYHHASKLVRGAYMEKERARALEFGYPSPIHNNIQETNNCYNNAVDYLLREMKYDSGLEFMCATHNQESIEFAIERFHRLGLDGTHNHRLSFAQLYGMSDDLTMPLGENGYNVYKYLPYGKIHEVIPYLLRRAQENGDVLGKFLHEKKLIYNELRQRAKLI